MKVSPDGEDPDPAPEPAPAPVSPGAAGEIGEPVAAGPDPAPARDADPPDGNGTFVPVAMGLEAVTNPEDAVTEVTLLTEVR